MPVAFTPRDSELVEAVRVALANLDADAELRDAVEPYGVNKPFRDDGQTRLVTAQGCINVSQHADGAQISSTAGVVSLKDDVTKGYTGLSELARAAFRGQPGKLAALGIVGRAPSRLADLLERGNKLFSAVKSDPDLAAGYQSVGQTAAKLAAIEEKFTELGALAAAQEAKKGAAQQATAECRAALEELRIWWGNAKRLARVALRGKPQLLEKIGVRAR